jgi:hypothetical protein
LEKSTICGFRPCVVIWRSEGSVAAPAWLFNLAQMESLEAVMMNPRRFASLAALAVVLAGAVAWLAGFGSAGIENSGAAPIVDRRVPSLTADVELAEAPQATAMDNAAVGKADVATAAESVTGTATDTTAASDEPAAIHQIAVSRPSVATPNARVADAFSAIPLNVTTVLTNLGAALPAIDGEIRYKIIG